MEIWVNPACSKCRTAVSALDEAGVDYTVRRYLEDPPTVEELATVVDRLGLEPWDLARPKEAREAGLTAIAKDAEHRTAWLAGLAANPRAIQRPIITADDGTTVIARDDETLGSILAH
ncbi:arsenate reductase [Mumia zhuanghuii]|uniref:ArsC/Spx/MgsR family protein n=2 Tax=Mumia TaxID=1546255 RepID=A0ABW1QH77_9ACTN|nr:MULTISPECIES: ArsC/Spx/MgsR family protein [Mumia]KAA1422773.1 arsenate reductase [Mumia zhuanghuii]